MSRSTRKDVKAVATARAPTPAERAAIEAAQTNQARRPSRAAVKSRLTEGNVLEISSPHTDQAGWTDQLVDAFGTGSDAFASHTCAQLNNAVADRLKGPTQEQTNAALALMGGIDPQNELEAALGVQIVAAHAASLDFLHRARQNAGEYRDTAVAYTNAATKLTRTMSQLVECLSKLRSGGKQQVEVRYVYVDARGSQNIIGSQLLGGGGTDGSGQQPHAPSLAFAPGVPMRSPHTEGDALPVASDPQQAPLSDARGEVTGRADGSGER